ncbi:MAG: DNA recombination protein RmuC [Colwellia sp.]|nr:DNA recombination protein RmuC [Colwellia sp.]MCW8864533.1 DNA recombination protein RmuC [Colwellia sp.]MCW9082231.1 DNA recombination protein RmuC [Colwellia sp.]
MPLNFSQLDPVAILLVGVFIFFIILLWQGYRISQFSQLMRASAAELNISSKAEQTLLVQLLEKQQLQLQNIFEQQMADLRIKLLRELSGQKEQLNQNQNQSLDQLITHLNKATQASREELGNSLSQSSEQMAKRIDALTQNTDLRLKEISNGVEKRLSEGFEKTTKTFSDILQRLALIDDAQKKITDLSNNVVSLQEVLNDKRSRGAFGEVQLNALIRNVLPEKSFKLQHTLTNGKIADCMLFLPEPTGNVVIDSKFPLESYRTMMDVEQGELERKTAQRQFKIDIKKHINDISDKYLIDKETADGAIMFIPAEAIFAEIHGHQSDLVDFANKKRVWLASPTTLMAILTTARSVLKDEATRSQIHIIQAHLSHLSQDFDRFKGRFANLAKHIDQAASDVKQIHTSADKISTRFEKIEQVDLQIVDNTEAGITSS